MMPHISYETLYQSWIETQLKDGGIHLTVEFLFLRKVFMDNNYVVILNFMTQELGLSGNELLIYALIYGFCQDKDSEFSGGRKYICDMFNISLPTVDKALKSLMDKELIIKTTSRRNNITLTSYKIFTSGKESLPGIKNLYPSTYVNKYNKHNNQLINNINNIDNKKEVKEIIDNKKEKKKTRFDECIDLINEFTVDIELSELLVSYLKMRIAMRDKPLYKNNWKGLLNKLLKLSTDVEEQRQIVRKSLNEEWASFYELAKTTKPKKKTPWNNDVTSESYTKEELKQLDEEEKKLNAKGIKTRF